MDVSIVIVSYNTCELLKDCLLSIKPASNNLKVEVFVVDNNSSDGTVQMVKKDFPWVNVIANKKNVGFSKANNQAIKIAKGKYLLILNPDTKLFGDTLIKMVEFIKGKKDIGVATCRVELPNGQLDRDCRRLFPTPWRALTYFSGLSKIFAQSKLFDQYQMGYLSDKIEHEVDSCVGAFMFVRREAIKKVGLFDEDFFFYGEDLDWCWRFREAGFKIIYTPTTKIIHYKGASSGIKKQSAHLSKATQNSKIRAVKESTRAMQIFYKKHYVGKYPSPLTWLVIFAVKIVEKYRLSKIAQIS